jgi:hypothetical protein
VFRKNKHWIHVERAKLGGMSQGMNAIRRVYAPFTTTGAPAAVACDATPCIAPCASPSAAPSAPRPDNSIKYKITEQDNELAIQAKYQGIRTIDELLEHCEVDTNIWEHHDAKVQKWDSQVAGGDTVELFNIKARLRRKGGSGFAELKAGLLEDIKRDVPFSSFERKSVIPAARQRLAVIGMPDLHLGKPDAHDPKAWTLEQASLTAFNTLRDMLEVNHFHASEILFPVGNDLVHFDSDKKQTTGGTQMDANASFVDAFRAAVSLMRRSIELCLEYAPVRLVVMPGNHDNNASLAVGECVAAIFENNPRVKINRGVATRQYEVFGKVLLGFEHGELKPNMPAQMMPLEQPKAWAETVYREWILGHFHRKKEVQFLPLLEHGGIRVRYLSSLSVTDKWHDKHGFKGIRGAEILYYDSETGYCGSVVHNLV